MPWPAIERIKYWCRRVLSRGYSELIQAAARCDIYSLFDRQFYIDQYADVALSGIDPLAHFLLYGAREFRHPHPMFDTAYYMAANSDVGAGGSNPLLHFLKKGWKEGRLPNPLFDPAWYQERYKPLEGVNLLVDYARRRAIGENVFPRPSLRDFLLEPAPAFKVPALEEPIDVIVPFRSGLDQTVACLESLVWSRTRNRFEIVIVAYGETDPELIRHVRTIACQRGWTLLESAGKTRSSSIRFATGMHPRRDVVLLDTGTRMSGDWLDRLAAVAYGGPQIGTASPFSTTEGACGYPDRAGVDELDCVFREVNGARAVAIPSPLGICTYIRREFVRAGDSLGRAAAPREGVSHGDSLLPPAMLLPCTHVLAAGVFAGRSCSSGTGAIGRATDCMHRTAFHRFAVSAARLRHCGRPVILAISHSLGGGVAEYLRRLRETLADRAEFVVLMPSGNLAILESLNPDYAFSLAIDPKDDYQALLEAIRQCGVARLHIQHVQGHLLDVDRLRSDIGLPFDFTLHDYYAICPQVHLNSISGSHCGEPPEAGCNRCLSERPVRPPRTIDQWRHDQSWLLRDAERVIAPSLDTAQRIVKYSPHLQIVVAAHPGPALTTQDREPPPLGARERLRVAILGTLSRHKGVALVRVCAQIARRHHLPVEFTLIGHVDRSLIPVSQPFRQTGLYHNAALPSLLAEVDPHVVWFPSQVPETYSFTLDSALRAGLPVIVPEIGALPERVSGLSWAWTIPPAWNAVRMVDFLLELRERHFRPHVAPPPPPGPVAVPSDFYETKYLPATKINARKSQP